MGVVLDYVVPICGTILTNALFFSPFPTIMRLDQSRQIGDLNPLPYPLMVFNCAAWVMYGLTFDGATVHFLFFGNFPGLINGIFYSLVAFPLASRQVQIYMRRLFVFLPLVCLSAAYFLAFALRANPDALHTALGVIAISVCVLFFGSPLSTIFQVLRTRSARSIHVPLSVTSGISTFLWAVYGVTLADWFLIIPNSLATIFSIIQLLLVFVFRKNNGNKGDQEKAVSEIPKEQSRSIDIPMDT